ncbi:hypothetical protein Tco_1244582 [Tanacetum coccineum]
MQIPKDLITDNIRNASYYNAYVEMVAKHDRKIAAAEGGKKKSASKADQSKKPTTTKQYKPAPAKKPKVAQEKPSEPSPAKQSKRGKVRKVRKGKSPLKLINEDEDVHHEPKTQGEGEEYDVERAIQMSKRKGIATNEHVAQSLLELQTPKKTSTTDQYIFQRRILVTEEAPTRPSAQPEDDTSTNIICDTPSPTNAEIDVANQVNIEDKTAEIDEGQARSDLGKTPESRPPPERVLMEEDQARPDPGPIHHPDEEHAQVENPLSLTGTLSSMKNLDAYTFGDQFFNDKPTKEEPDKANMEIEVECMVIVLIHQASSSVPLLSTPVIDLTPSKPVSPTIQAPIFTATTATTTTTLPLPPQIPQQPSSTDPDLDSRVSALEQVCANFEKRHKLQDKTVQGLSSRVFNLELCDLTYKIDETVREAVKEAVQIVLQAPLKERFKDLSKANMKEILHDRMFESGTYRSQPEHVALYEALESSIERDNRDKFLVEKDKSQKRRHDKQDPPHPPPDSYLSKMKRHDSDASGLKQPPVPQFSAWQMFDTREAPSSSSKQKFISHSEQFVEEVPMLDDVNISDLEDTDTAHLPKIKTRPDWLKHIGKSKLSKADLEGPTYKVVRAFHSNNISLQFQMEECHLLLTDQIDLVNPEGNRLVPNMGKPLPLGGPPGQVTIQPQFFFNKDLDYLVSSSKERRNALSISKLKVAHYPDFRLEELVPSLWIESEPEYDISEAYEITH